MVEGPTVYELPYFVSSKIFVTRVFLRLRNHTFNRYISGLEQDGDNLKQLLPTKSHIPYRLVPLPSRSLTILLPVWRFWPFGVIKTVRNGALEMSTVVGLVAGRGSKGARTGGHGVARVDSDHAECGGVSNRIKDSVL